HVAAEDRAARVVGGRRPGRLQHSIGIHRGRLQVPWWRRVGRESRVDGTLCGLPRLVPQRGVLLVGGHRHRSHLTPGGDAVGRPVGGRPTPLLRAGAAAAAGVAAGRGIAGLAGGWACTTATCPWLAHWPASVHPERSRYRW